MLDVGGLVGLTRFGVVLRDTPALRLFDEVVASHFRSAINADRRRGPYQLTRRSIVRISIRAGSNWATLVATPSRLASPITLSLWKRRPTRSTSCMESKALPWLTGAPTARATCTRVGMWRLWRRKMFSLLSEYTLATRMQFHGRPSRRSRSCHYQMHQRPLRSTMPFKSSRT